MSTVLVTGVSSGFGKYAYENIPGAVGLSRHNREDIIKCGKEYDMIIHSAFAAQGAGKNNISNHWKYVDDNILLTKELASVKCNKFVYMSSVIAYSQDISIYKHTKALAEAIIQECCEDYLILRCSSMVGPTMKKNTIRKVIEDAEPNVTLSGDSMFNFIHYKDVLDFILNSSRTGADGIVDFVAPDRISLREVCDRLGKKVHFGDYTFLGPPGDISRLLRFCPEASRGSWDALCKYSGVR